MLTACECWHGFRGAGFWDFITWVKFRFATPADISCHGTLEARIIPKPMVEAIPAVPVTR